MSDDTPEPAAFWPSNLRLLLILAVVVVTAYYPAKIVIQVVWANADTTARHTTAEPRPHRLFDEYPDLVADQVRHPAETEAAVWVSFRHVPPADLADQLSLWGSGALGPAVAVGLYRLDCSGHRAEAMKEILARYPYAVAPVSAAGREAMNAYLSATAETPFRVSVVRGDWLAAAFAGRPDAAREFGVTATPADAERYGRTTVSAECLLAPFPADVRGNIPCPDAGVTRRELESADETGQSLFARWARTSGVAVPVR